MQLICGDMHKKLRAFRPESFDLICTDPPYNLGKDYGPTYNDALPSDQYWDQYGQWFREIFRVAKDPSILYVSCATLQQWTVKSMLEIIGWKFEQPIIWHGANVIREKKVSGHYLNKPWTISFEPILMFRKGKRQPMLQAPTELTFDVMICAKPQSNYKKDTRVAHQTQKPLELIIRLLIRTPGKKVLDPFMGSGTAAVACYKLRRTFVGIDINPDYIEIAEARVEAEKANYNIFDETYAQNTLKTDTKKALNDA